jgi:TldD protein
VRDLTDRALNVAQLAGASYADLRIVRSRAETVQVKNGQVAAITDTTSEGLGVRVVADGAWGFAATADLTRAEAERATRLAVAIAKASARVPRAPVTLAPVTPETGTWESPHKVDPFGVPLGEKIALLLAADREMRSVPGVTVAESSCQAWEDRKVFASTEGAYLQQRILQTGGGIKATAVQDGDAQVRSYPCSFGGQFETRGFELVTAFDLPAHAAETASEAVALLSAKQCPIGEFDIILDGSQVSLQVHESCGHPIELDRVLGWEANYAGTSFLTQEKLGQFRYGSPLVNIVADATTPYGLGSFRWDDEGVPAARADIVRDGMFVGYMTSRETAAALGLPTSNGTMRADGWQRLPLIRMTCVNLEPGTWSLEDLIADTDDGILMSTNRSWSIDDRRFNFQFGTEIAWEIKKGKRGALLKNATYTGITPEFWALCDAICDAQHWRIWGTPNCGKGQPSQTMRTAQGASPARFRKVRVGVGYAG